MRIPLPAQIWRTDFSKSSACQIWNLFAGAVSLTGFSLVGTLFKSCSSEVIMQKEIRLRVGGEFHQLDGDDLTTHLVGTEVHIEYGCQVADAHAGAAVVKPVRLSAAAAFCGNAGIARRCPGF